MNFWSNLLGDDYNSFLTDWKMDIATEIISGKTEHNPCPRTLKWSNMKTLNNVLKQNRNSVCLFGWITSAVPNYC